MPSYPPARRRSDVTGLARSDSSAAGLAAKEATVLRGDVTRALLDWEPGGPTLLEDIAAGAYFNA